MRKLTTMTEQRAKEIWSAHASDLSISLRECRDADRWIKATTLNNLREKLSQCGHESSKIREYVLLMAQCTFGSMETDQLLQNLDCYPDWMNDKVAK